VTREEKIQILDNAQDRIYQAINAAEGSELGSEAFSRLIYLSDSLEFQIARLRDNDYARAFLPIPNPEGVGPAEEPVPADPPAPAPESEKEGGDEEPQYKMEEVRAALAKARGRGVNVSEIIRSFGADNFQQITPDKYPAIMEKLA
jgi:hypothetical protein